MPETVPADVVRMLQDCIEGYEHLEILLAILRDRSQSWTAEAMAAALNIDPATAEKALNDLVRTGLLEAEPKTGAYRFNPADVRRHVTAERLVEQYETNSIAIMQLLNANAIARVRGSALRAFADAFVVRRKKDDG